MRGFVQGLVVIATLTTVGSAGALEQKTHRSLARAACRAQHLPDDFCARVGVEAYNVDAHEWNDLSAHAQPEAGQTRCAAAAEALERVRSLGDDTRRGLADLASSGAEEDATFVAVQLGRALHTVQDNCAHHGMTNPQHAWASLSDSCEGTKESPDIQAAAVTCAAQETAAVMAAFATAMRDAGVDPSALDEIDRGWSHWPRRADVCGFLGEAPTWAGDDTRWDNTLMVPALRRQLVNALTGNVRPIEPVCAAGPSALTPALDAQDTSSPPGRCFKVRTYCLGKSDAVDEAPPWDDGVDEELVDPAPAAGGCAVDGHGDAGDPWAFLLLGAPALVLLRRRG